MVRIVHNHRLTVTNSNIHGGGQSNNGSCCSFDRWLRIGLIVLGIVTLTTFVWMIQLLSTQFSLQHQPANDVTLTSSSSSSTKERLRGEPIASNTRKDVADESHNNRNHETPNVVTKRKDGSSTGSSTVNVNVNVNPSSHQHPLCPYTTLSDLTVDERYPQKSNLRHMVSPPKDGNVTLVCCHTTVGPWNILVHDQWAPRGAQRFLDMVTARYFDTTVPLMRCIPNFICQFGLNGNPTAMKPFMGKKSHPLKDDTNWLPEGPEHRIDPVTKRKRFQRGYLAYAGSGTNSRDVQFIVALQDNGPLGGGSPWEVPWGELVGQHSYDTLNKIYTGYGENGPSQGLLHKADALAVVKEKYPLLDYIQSCHITDSA